MISIMGFGNLIKPHNLYEPMDYINVICGVSIFILMFCNIYIGRKIQKSSLHLNMLKESLKNAQDDLNTLAQQRQAVYLETEQLKQDRYEVRKDIDFLNNTASQLHKNLQEQKEEINNDFISYKKQVQQSAMEYREDIYNSIEQDLLTVQKDFTEQFKSENIKKLNAAKELSDKLQELKSSVDAATKIAKAELEKENYNEYHSLQISQEDIQEINKIEAAVIGVTPVAQMAIAKVIWKVYYEKAYTDLIGRLFNNRQICGIYKITDIKDNRCYVGQAVDIADRWRQHIKRAIGAEEKTNNKLYPAMNRLGPWNFTFDIIEECSRDKLNVREDYWQEFYHAKDFGYSIK